MPMPITPVDLENCRMFRIRVEQDVRMAAADPGLGLECNPSIAEPAFHDHFEGRFFFALRAFFLRAALTFPAVVAFLGIRLGHEMDRSRAD